MYFKVIYHDIIVFFERFLEFIAIFLESPQLRLLIICTKSLKKLILLYALSLDDITSLCHSYFLLYLFITITHYDQNKPNTYTNNIKARNGEHLMIRPYFLPIT